MSQVFLRDTGNIVAVVNNFIRFGVPMMYPYAIVADRFRGHTDLYLANPIADAVLLVQRCFWVPTTSDPAAVATPVTAPGATDVAAMPDHLFERGLIALVAAFVLLVDRPADLRALREQDAREAVMTDSIVVEHVSKQFTKQYHRTLKQVSVAMMRRQQVTNTFLALDDVSFRVEQGEAIGLMGLNGSGKSTLLKVVQGVMSPDEGSVKTRGRIAGLIATGAGFHPQLTGRENIYLNAAILGMSEAETNRKFEAITDFADIDDFLDSPVGYYSSGMYARLGFAIAIHVDADIFLADEALSVGDKPFKVKCMKKLQEIKDSGVTIFYVSHAAGSVRKICDRVLVLEKGVLGFDGDVEAGIKYVKYDDESEGTDDELGSEI